ncbi:hypothetical protein Cantr_00452 [Candida viswanathii]|uniref:Uncharacterized protein n=1 Tax=Candida viswanathii TaxID=5486 RepID=A0A367YF01_9ASCO|nr:hypothetical protein Cantr_00452 [Candida viswanathii]
MKSESPHTEQVLDYLKSEYSSYLARAKEDKEGENYKVYRSLESPNQWTSNTTSSRQSSSKYNPKEVIRNRPGNNNTLDLLFEINRSVYQQRERQNRG